MVRDIEIIKNCDPILKNKIVLYGGGYYGKRAVAMLRKLGIPIEAVCTTVKEETPLIKGIRHISVTELKGMDDRDNLLIVIATIVGEFMEQIVDTLDQHHITRGIRITYLGLRYACLLNEKIDKRGILTFEWKLWYVCFENSVRCRVYGRLWAGFSENAVWVYTAGKVGSTTIAESLEQLGIPKAHVHEIDEMEVKRSGALYLDGRKRIFEHGFENHNLFLKKLKAQEHIQIITMVREPIARDISRYFECFYVDYTTWADQTNDLYRDFITMTEGFLKDNNQFHWFDKEIKQVFGVDIYEYPFDKKRGYAVIERDNISILVLKLEMLNQLESVIGDFLKVKNFKLVKANEAKNKHYRYMYEEFKRNIKFPRSYIDKYYKNNLHMDHFYSEEEKSVFLQRWNKNIGKD